MSFFSFLKNAASKTYDYMEKTQEKVFHYEEIHYNKSNEELLKIMKTGSGGIGERMAAKKILKERGHNFEE